MAKVNKRRVGAEYESLAVEYLKSKGYRILEQNYRNRYGEIDIIAEVDDTLVFCEIKYRSTQGYGDPLEAVDYNKQRHISRVALYYYTFHGYEDSKDCRFDVIAIHGDNTIVHVENAFEFVGD